MYTRCRLIKRLKLLSPYAGLGKRLPSLVGDSGPLVFCIATLAYPSRSDTIGARIISSRFQSSSCSNTVQVPSEACRAESLVSFIESCRTKLRGLNHCWFNIDQKNLEATKKSDSFLVIAGDLIGDARVDAMLELAKILQHRFPKICVIAFPKSGLECSATGKADLAELVMRKFLTFPILLSDKNFVEMDDKACYILFKDFKFPIIYKEKDMDPALMIKAIGNMIVHKRSNVVDNNSPQLKRAWYKEVEMIKEPLCCSPLQNLALYFPGCVSADELASRLFLSDSNHHRVLVIDEIGNIVDCIGSSPGFADGEFEYAKFSRPGATFYDDTADCLYIVDSENHAIRKADMEKRTVETIYPIRKDGKKTDGVWAWVLKKLDLIKEVDYRPKDFDYDAVFFPWHLLKSENNDFFVINATFDKLWILDTVSGEIKERILGYSQVVDACKESMKDKMSLLNQIPSSWLRCLTRSNNFASIFSSVSSFDNGIVMCDNVGSRLSKLNLESGELSRIKLSNFHQTGFPYWLSLPLEKFYMLEEAFQQQINRFESFEILPGKVTIHVNLSLPEDTELVEPMREDLIWCQARGSATVFNGSMETSELPEKVNITQQWYNELDNLAFSTESAASNEDSSDTVVESDGKFLIKCSAHTSPGTSEIFISSVFYLKLQGHSNSGNCPRRLISLLSSGGCEEVEKDTCVQLLSKSDTDLAELVFIKPIHLRLRLNCLDYPKADIVRHTKITESVIELDVAL